MSQIARTITAQILEANNHFPIVLITGPRQVGKTTVLQSLAGNNRTYITLDDLDARLAAKTDPAGFLERLQLPVLIDEVQYAPELFPYMKILVDKQKKKGLIWLTGSQQFAMMQNVSESLAGRIAILDMQGISLAEEQQRPNTPPFLPSKDKLSLRLKNAKPQLIQETYYKIWRGSFPDIVTSDGKIWQRFYESYITTYIERDVRGSLKIEDLLTFRRFMQVAASRSGQILNYSDLAKDVGISEPTVKSWISVLQASGIITLLQPYFNNITKRLIKTPKLYFMDTGLCCYLTRWSSPEVLENGMMAGAILETYVVSEIIKSYIHNGKTPPIYYYRDKEKREVDLLIEADGYLHPIEIKKAVSVYNTNFKGFDFLKNTKTKIGYGCILCFAHNLLPYSKDIDIVPIYLI